MAVELDHPFTTARPIDESYATLLALERVVPCVEGGSVLETVGPDAAAHRVVMRVKSREAGGQGYANADVSFALTDGGGTIHTNAQIAGKAASMGEGVTVGVLD